MLDDPIRAFDDAVGLVGGELLLPVLYAAGLMAYEDDAHRWLSFVALGALHVAVVYAVCRPLEAWRPVEPPPKGAAGRGAVRTDVVYSLVAPLGLLPLLAFALLHLVEAPLGGFLADRGWVPPTLETLLPALRDRPFVAFLLYVAVLDLGEYWRHRLQHMIPWWWALHSVHHGQRHMTFWTDDRNHVLDDVIGALWIAGLAMLVGVPPGQFPLVALVLRLSQGLSHANARIQFGRVGERLLVSPRFHRVHHGVGSVERQGVNYAVLLPVWDVLFRTADFRRDHYPPTGDPEGPEALATGGWWAQQVAGARRLWEALRGRRA